MPALDTNVLVRFLVQDDAAQLAAAQRLIANAITQGQTLFVPITMALELEWVLRSTYRRPKDEVTTVISHLLSATELSFESERALEVGLQLYREGSADFADCLHIALAQQAGETPLWTLDKAAAKVQGAALLARGTAS